MSYGFYKDQVFCVSRLKLLQALSDASLGHTPLRVLDFRKQSFTISSEVDDKPSETKVQILERTPCNIHAVLTDLKLFPRTGRKHQLRIHCANVLGTPFLGDDLYWHGSTEVRKRQGLYLYCKQVSMDHPLTKTNVSAGIQEPLRFTRTREKARKGYEWSRANGESSEDNARNHKD